MMGELVVSRVDQIAQGTEIEPKSPADEDLSVEAVGGSNHLGQLSRPHAAPRGDVKHRQGIVGAEEEAFMNLRIAAEVQQHAHTVGQRQCGDIGVEMRVAFGEVVKGRQEFLMEHESVTTGMACDNRGAFIQCDTESIRISDRLILPDETKLVPDMTQEGQFPFGQHAIEGFVTRVSRIEMLRIGQHFDQGGSGIGATMDLLDRVPSLRIDRDAGQ